jgi:hypothetical protein
MHLAAAVVAKDQSREHVGVIVAAGVRTVRLAGLVAPPIMELGLDSLEQRFVDERLVSVLDDDPGFARVIDRQGLSRRRQRYLSSVPLANMARGNAVVLALAALGPGERAGVIPVLEDRFDRGSIPGTRRIATSSSSALKSSRARRLSGSPGRFVREFTVPLSKRS